MRVYRNSILLTDMSTAGAYSSDSSHTGRKIKVAVVDDQNVARGFFEMNVKASLNYELVGSLPAAEHVLSFLEYNDCDLLIMDIMMRYGADGLTTAEKVKARFPKVKIILATSMAESDWEDRARKIGVESFWYKEYSQEPLIEIMDRTMSGESVYPTDSPNIRFGNIDKKDLTDRELDVLRVLITGATNDEIARELDLSVNTVKSHVQNLLDKTGFDNRLAMAINAKDLGLVAERKEKKGEKDETDY